MALASAEDLAILESPDNDPANFHRRIAAVWAHAHDLAIAKHGESNVGSFFVGASGTKHLMELEALPLTATAAEILAVSKRTMGVE